MLKKKTEQVFLYIHDRSRSRGAPPTLREIGEEFGIASTNGVRYHLEALERHGYIRRNKRIARGLEVTDFGVRRFVGQTSDRAKASTERPVERGIPILGRVAAGSPILADENLEGHLDLDRAFPSRAERFALRVRGDSMIDAGIRDGDFVVVRRADRAESGEIVVALVGEEATVKTLRVHKDRVELLPANPDHKRIVVRNSEQFRVLGVVLGLVRAAGRGGFGRA